MLRDRSRWRQRLLDACSKHRSLVDTLLAERGPLLRGTFQLRGTRCGKGNCKCMQGELHTTAILVVSEDGARRSIYVRGPDRPEVQRRTDRYRRFRKTRAELVKLDAEMLTAVDKLLETLLEPYVPQRDGRKSRTRRPGRKRKKRGKV